MTRSIEYNRDGSVTLREDERVQVVPPEQRDNLDALQVAFFTPEPDGG